MFNPLELVPLWRALRHFSLTFAVVFASALLGLSVTQLLRRLLGELSLPWIFLWLGPAVLIGLVARYESRWIPEEKTRRRCALGIVIGALILSVVVARIRAAFAPPPEAEPAPASAPTTPGPTRRGPPAK